MPYARTFKSGDGSTRDFIFGFPYLDQAHVKVYVDGTLTTEWSFFAADTVRFNVAPASGAVILITRATSPTTRLVDYTTPSSLNEADMDADSLQAFYLAQEATDTANAALTVDQATGHLTARNLRIANMADPVNAQDAVTKSWAETALSSQLALAIAARTAAELARDAALAAQALAETAQSGAEAAQAAALASQAAALASENTATAQAAAAALDAAAADASRVAAEAAESGAGTSEANAAASAAASAASAAAAATSEANAASSAAAAAASEANAAVSAAAAAAVAASVNLDQGVNTTDSPTFAGLTVDTDTLVVDTVNSRVGFNTLNPLQALHVTGNGIVSGNFAVGTTNFGTDLGYGAKVKVSGSGPAFYLEETDTGQAWAIGALGSDFIIRDATGLTSVMRVKTGISAEALQLNADGFVEFLRGYKETTYALTGVTPALDPANGTIQTWTLTGNSTPTDNIGAGESITLMIDDGTAYTVTWPTMTWVNNGGTAPDLATTGYTVVTLWKVGSTLYGALVGDGS